MTNGSSEDSVRQTSNGEGVGRDKLAAEWIQPGYRAEVQSKMLENQVLQRVREATDLIKSVKLERNEEQPVVSMDWDQLYDVSSNIMEEFTKEMDEIVAELNQSFKKQLLWQEAAFTVDSHRGATRFGAAESWMKSKETHLEQKRRELNASARIIKSTLENLTQG
ncbi:AER137Wp [Eremothecium gossypii ATCC 10895]|uniref:AER137Wp n=1 Tax=Eremothecium gossypii (strain ATCC 10895 / CBS 109.51 / FGSC 9923 / NRRL Y-1056) TaxID=284811 RepID=Q756X7_EREGS|nr:AER137Wp [Eremothecium gossypii ATCC 10895]AAS52820.1 AER137Wp [Eremothecium gossypii ATCC 10895]AEY97126.1 FAER137Wp [Eremothecium gossypii FDAG1]